MRATRKTLFGVLHRLIFCSVALTLLVSGSLFTMVFFHSLRAQHESNMTLIARATAYTVEAAVMFNDPQAAKEILDNIRNREKNLCEITIYTADGNTFTQSHSEHESESERPCSNPDDNIVGSLAARIFSADMVRIDAHPDNESESSKNRVYVIELKGDGSVFVSFLYKGLSVLIFCLVLAGVAAGVLAYWMKQRFAAELGALSGMAHAARLEGDFTRRLPTFEIAEFNGLGQDFNALFGEIQTRNAELKLRQSQLEIVNHTLERMAKRDSLTGLANRACFSEQLNQALEKAGASETCIGVLYIDNDHFKDINDSYGHAAGDALLVNIGRRLSGAVRESDLVARLGGDEFAILLTPVGNEGDLLHVANKVLAAMARKLRLSEREGADVDIELGVSIGMAIFPSQASDADALLRAADHAMYRAKRLGRGRACMYDPAIDATLEDA